MPDEDRPTVDGVYAWAARSDVPMPDMFAAWYWYLDGREVRLRLVAIFWKYLVHRGIVVSVRKNDS